MYIFLDAHNAYVEMRAGAKLEEYIRLRYRIVCKVLISGKYSEWMEKSMCDGDGCIQYKWKKVQQLRKEERFPSDVGRTCRKFHELVTCDTLLKTMHALSWSA